MGSALPQAPLPIFLEFISNQKRSEFEKDLSCTNFCYSAIMYYVYFLINSNSQLYFGSTNDLRKRVAQHNRSNSKYLKGYTWRLVYYEVYLSEADARER